MESRRFFCPITGSLLRHVAPEPLLILGEDSEDPEVIPEGLNLTIERLAVDSDAYALATSAETQAEMRATLRASGVPEEEIEGRVVQAVAEACAPVPTTFAIPHISWPVAERAYNLLVKDLPAIANLFKPPTAPAPVQEVGQA